MRNGGGNVRCGGGRGISWRGWPRGMLRGRIWLGSKFRDAGKKPNLPINSKQRG